MKNNYTQTFSSKRITVIDALRGFSLIGICLIHAMQHFGVFGSMSTQILFPGEETLNSMFSWFISHFIFGKFFIIFSCLFGLSFFIQMNRAAQKGIDFRKRFLWRLTLLLMLGYLHSLIVRVDILIIYAILGFILLLVYKWPTKLLVGITLFLFLGGATLVPVLYKNVMPEQITKVEYAVRNTETQQTTKREIPTLKETIKDNAWNGIEGKIRFQFASGRIYITMGLFILGLIVGRINLFENIEKYRTTLRRFALFSTIALLLLYTLQSHIPPTNWREITYTSWLNSTATNIINLFTAYLWVIVLIEVYRFQKMRDILTPLVLYGRMGLTNYIVQSVIGVFIFSGFGLDWSNLGVFLSVIVCLTYTVIQIILSNYWLKHFRFGPMEWIWRSGTYMRWQSLSKSS